MRAAVIDCGSNTFNLLIAEPSGTGMNTIFGRKLAPKLGAGIQPDGSLSEEAMLRGFAALREHKADIERLGADSICAFATSAVRSATNGEEFARRAALETGIDINIISGDKEAELIYYGNTLALEIPEQASLIVDIGGGSNEFIICNAGGVLWKQSFDLGTFRLIKRFAPHYPIHANTVGEMRAYFEQELQPLIAACAEHRPRLMIGSSGSFDTFRAMLEHTQQITVPQRSSSFEISIPQIYGMCDHICSLSLEEIARVPGIDAMRVEVITVASVFVRFVVERLEIESISQSSFSLKEGVLFKLFSGMAI